MIITTSSSLVRESLIPSTPAKISEKSWRAYLKAIQDHSPNKEGSNYGERCVMVARWSVKPED